MRKLVRMVRYKAIELYQKYIINSLVFDDANIVVMLIPNLEVISGGVLSIYSFYYATKSILKNSVVLACTYPNRHTPMLYAWFKVRYKWFKNEVDLVDFKYLLSSKKKIKSLLLHIPEYYVIDFVNELTEKQYKILRSIDSLHINVMNQNDELMPSVDVFNKLTSITKNITMTTAHTSYTNQYLRDKYNVPVHLLSAWFEQNEIAISRYTDKRDIMIVSHDAHPDKESILSKIKSELPHIEQVIVKNMKYEDYKALESVAKWSLSFGEGFDGYTVFPALKGGVTFAVYNETFFDYKYKHFSTFYDSYLLMSKCIVDDIKKFDNPDAYNQYNDSLRTKLQEDYSYKSYLDKVRMFYNADYTIL